MRWPMNPNESNASRERGSRGSETVSIESDGYRAARPRSVLMATLGLLFCLTTLVQAQAEPASLRPNILIVLVDDMRFDQMTHEGHPYIETPNLDRLAVEGVRFTNAYVTSPLCGPSRASLVTGRQPSIHGRLHNHVYPALDPYLPAVFRPAGYRTAMIGKFYEGADFADELRDQTFDRWFQNGGPYWPDFEGEPEDRKARRAFYDARLYYDQFYDIDGQTRRVMGHQTDVLFDEASRFALESVEADRPFMMLLNPFAPHTPLNPSLERKGKHAGKGIPPRPNQVFGELGPMNNAHNHARIREVHERGSEMIEDVDAAMGRLLENLQTAGVLDETLIVFTSDNGTVHGEHGFWWKMNFWEEAVRIPLLMRYPKLIEAGTASDALVSISDLLPTAAELGGVAIPEDANRYGRSLVPHLREGIAGLRDHLLCMQFSQLASREDVTDTELMWASLKSQDGWKLIAQRVPSPQRPELPKFQLFHLLEDPFEMWNLAESDEHQARLGHMKNQLAEALSANAAPYAWVR